MLDKGMGTVLGAAHNTTALTLSTSDDVLGLRSEIRVEQVEGESKDRPQIST